MSPDSTPLRRRPYIATLGAVSAFGIGIVILNKTLQGTSDSRDLLLWSIALAVTWLIGFVVIVASTPSTRIESGWGERLQARSHPLLFSLTIGALFAIASLIGALVIREIPALSSDVTATAGRVSADPLPVFVIAVMTGVAEELFFRLGLFRLLPKRFALVISTVLYGAVTLASGNLPLTLAAVLLGATCGITLTTTGRWYAPIIVHGLWSLLLVGLLPQL